MIRACFLGIGTQVLTILPSADQLCLVQLWPEDKFPLQEFGRMVLDENIKNYFSDVESIAFDPGVTVPGESPAHVLMYWHIYKMLYTPSLIMVLG